MRPDSASVPATTNFFHSSFNRTLGKHSRIAPVQCPEVAHSIPCYGSWNDLILRTAQIFGLYPLFHANHPMSVNYKKHLKSGIKLVIEGDANPVTIIVRLSKSQLLKILDNLLPDEEE